MSVLNSNPFLIASGSPTDPTFPLQRSVRLRSSATAYFTRTPASAGNQKTFTFSFWVKRGTLSANQEMYFTNLGGGTFTQISWSATNTIAIASVDSSVASAELVTSAVYRDPSAWYHLVFAVDTTQATASNRIKVYVNGVQVTAFNTATYPSLNYDFKLNNVTAQYIGRPSTGTLDGYLTEFYFINGQALTPSSFGGYNSGTGVWEPRKYAGTYGTNGFYLNFQDNSGATATTIGKDSSGNGNNWTPNNISVTAGVTYDSMTDVPTLTSATNANFATLNPLDKNTSASLTISNGNLTSSTTANNIGVRGTIGVSSGKWYWEHTLTTAGGVTIVGIADAVWNLLYVGSTAYSYGYSSDAFKYNNGGNTVYGTTYTTGDVIGVAFDADAATLVFYKNGATQGTAFSSIPAGVYFPAVSGQINGVVNSNFGQRPFTYTPPTGFKSLNTYNLPTPAIANGATQFAATLWTGDGADPRAINNSGSMQPDLVWIKARGSSTLSDNVLDDSVRGATKDLFSNLTAAEGANNSVRSFNTNGFSVGNSTRVNQNSIAYVGWQWKASNAAAVTNTSGTISSQVSANPSAGFSIVTRTGTGVAGTVGHGLGIAPKMIINKSRSNGAYNWSVYHASLTNANFVVYLDATNAQQSDPNTWNGTAPTSTVFSIGSGAQTNLNTATYVNYCFSEIAGYSKFASYIGNGSTDGTFVFLGFRPRWLMIKRIDTAGYGWNIYDTTRSPYNIAQIFLQTNVANAETNNAAYAFDLLSNGFKLRQTDALINASGGTYIYAAFAESPFNYSLAR